MKKSVIWIVGIIVLIILFALAVNYSVSEEDGEDGLAQSPPKPPNVIPGAPSKPRGDGPAGAGAADCQQATEECNGKKCCDTATAPGTDYDGLPLICYSGVCWPRCTFNENKPVTCDFISPTGDLTFWCCAQNEGCANAPNECKSISCNSTQIMCGDAGCCNVGSGRGLPDEVCRFDPKDNKYTCDGNDIGECPDVANADCKVDGGYYCMTTGATSKCVDGRVKCCFNYEMCVENKDFELNCFEPGFICLNEDKEFAGTCSATEKCCNDKNGGCCPDDTKCCDDEEGGCCDDGYECCGEKCCKELTSFCDKTGKFFCKSKGTGFAVLGKPKIDRTT